MKDGGYKGVRRKPSTLRTFMSLIGAVLTGGFSAPGTPPVARSSALPNQPQVSTIYDPNASARETPIEPEADIILTETIIYGQVDSGYATFATWSEFVQSAAEAYAALSEDDRQLAEEEVDAWRWERTGEDLEPVDPAEKRQLKEELIAELRKQHMGDTSSE